jgi:GrpB-like predicted nucleotidyltransferase (UPF0157 family)
MQEIRRKSSWRVSCGRGWNRHVVRRLVFLVSGPTMISIVPHRATWSVEFDGIAASIQAGTGEVALRIDHIGSTSVPYLCAKDVIDVQVTVAKLDGGVAERLRQLGFVQRGDIEGDHVPPGYGGPESDWAKLFFVQPSDQRRINVHVRQSGRPNQRYALLFRDYLIAHPRAAAAYGELKQRLAGSLVTEDAYADVKDPAVDLIYFAAEEWASHSQWQLYPRPEDRAP